MIVLPRTNYYSLLQYGQVLVADYNNSRIHLLNSDLTLQRKLLLQSDGLDKPRRLLLDEDRGLLYVGQDNGEVKIFRVADPKPSSIRQL